MNPRSIFNSSFLILTFTSVFVFCKSTALAQDTTLIDSLNQIATTQQGAEKAETLRMIAYNYSESDINISKNYLYKALSEIDSVSEPELWGAIYSNLGIVYENLQQLDSVEFVYHKALSVARLIKDKDSALMATVYFNLAGLYVQKADYPKATTYAVNSLRIRENNLRLPRRNSGSDTMYVASGYSLLGNIKMLRGEYAESKSAYQVAYQLYDELGKEAYKMLPLANLGICAKYEEKYDSALIFMHRSREIAEELGYPSYMANVYNNIGQVYAKLSNWKEAKSYYEKALVNYEKAEDKVKQIKVRAYMGNLELAQNNVQAAINILESCVSDLDQLEASEDKQSILTDLAEAYEANGNYQQALIFAKKGEEIRKEILNREKEKDIATIETAYETEKKEQRIREQSQKLEAEQARNRVILIASFSIGVLLCVVFLLTWIRSRLNQKVRMGELLAAQQQRRFAAVIGAEEKERKRIARELHDGLGQLLATARMNVAGLDDVMEQGDQEDQKIYHTSLELIDEACGEVRTISHNLMPSALLHAGLVPALRDLCRKIEVPGKMKVEFSASEVLGNLDEAYEINIYRIVQELIGNTIKHSGATSIALKLKPSPTHLEIILSDNGKGLSQAQIENSDGIGWDNIQSRLEMLGGSLNLANHSNKGTSIELTIPIR